MFGHLFYTVFDNKLLLATVPTVASGAKMSLAKNTKISIVRSSRTQGQDNEAKLHTREEKINGK
jgi:hypothetical protein